MCLGRFSAVTFQVLGHTKTILVLLISWLVLHEHMTGRKLFGMALAVAGMIAYGHYNGKAAAMSTVRSAESLPLLNKQRVTSDNEVRRAAVGRGGEGRGCGGDGGCCCCGGAGRDAPGMWARLGSAGRGGQALGAPTDRSPARLLPPASPCR
jgi:solute carrier family 35 protein E3